MTLLETQMRFTRNLAKLLTLAAAAGYAITLGKPQEQHMPQSLHYQGLAMDLNLFVRGPEDWSLVTGQHEAWDELGGFWKGLDPDNAWGGDFEAKDYRHFSLAYGGRK